jgi:4-hydroxy-2-oxoheptanedioate aldolase
VTGELKRKLGAGGFGLGVTLNFPHVGFAEFLGQLGFDCVIIDGEHGAIGDKEIEEIALACDSTGCASMLRIDVDNARLQRYINLGITGIQLPQARSASHVQDVVDAVKFAPIGRRGLANSRASRWGLRDGDLATQMAADNARTAIMVQIEDRAGIAALPAIVRIAEVDAIIVGQMDLSNDLGFTGQLDHPTVVAAVDEIVRVAKVAGKPVGLPVNRADDIRPAVERGASYFVTSAARCVEFGAKALLDAVSALQ